MTKLTVADFGEDFRQRNAELLGQSLQKMQQVKGRVQSVPPLSTPTKQPRGYASVKNRPLLIPLAPVAKARARTVMNNGKVHSYTPEKTEEYEFNLRCLLVGQIPRPILKPTPIKLTVTFYIQQPARSKLDYPTIRPDVDNYCKSLFDAANGILWEDDSQIIELHARKVYTNKEGYIELEVMLV